VVTARSARPGSVVPIVAWLVVALLAPLRSLAATTPQRVLEAVEMRDNNEDVDVIVRFMTPVRYLRHAPASSGNLLQIQVDPVSLAPRTTSLLAGSETLAAPRDSPVPLLEVAYEGGRPDGRYLVLRFSRTVSFEVRQGSDFRSLIISVRAHSTPGGRALPGSSDSLLQSDQLMATGRDALTSGDADLAIRVFTKIVSMPEHANSIEAKELLGVARERRGQLAHAKAEYEEYLKWYPAGEGAQRVRQRLDALLTASSKAPEAPGNRTGETTRPSDIETFGSASTQYRREVVDSSAAGSLLADSSLFSDLSVSTRARSDNFLWRGLAAGSYRFDFVDGMSENETRISSFFLDVGQRSGPYSATFGRQPGNTAGVTSRFDGIRLSRRIAEQWRVSLRGGFPVEIQNSDHIETERYLYGVSLDGEDLGGHVDVQLFALQQQADGVLDRNGVGGELRYAEDGLFVASYTDYDTYFGNLNTALLSSNWQIGPTTSATLYVDYRNSPILASWNAIQGQSVDNLSDLAKLYSNSEIKQLAQDRTPRSTLASLGGSQQLTDRLQLALDVSASYLSDTPASGGVEAMASTGWEFSYYPQLVVSSLFTNGDVGTIGVRYFDGTLSDTWSLIINERYPITPQLRILPRVRVDWRNRSGRDEFLPNPDATAVDPIAAAQAARSRNGSLTVRPYLGIEWRVWKLTLFGDAGAEWTSGSFDAGGGDEFVYAFSGGLRYDF
jgi:hypothetical protein